MISKRVLVLDDDKDICDLVEDAAQDMGHSTESLINSTEFTAAFERFQPDIVVFDIFMPEIDGFEILQELLKPNRLRSWLSSPDQVTPILKLSRCFATRTGIKT